MQWYWQQQVRLSFSACRARLIGRYAKLRKQNTGREEPHNVKYWGLGNESEPARLGIIRDGLISRLRPLAGGEHERDRVHHEGQILGARPETGGSYYQACLVWAQCEYEGDEGEQQTDSAGSDRLGSGGTGYDGRLCRSALHPLLVSLSLHSSPPWLFQSLATP